ncbi:hypothetical protein NliqN6_2336 [Naganishia liquefaciens]|uniref:Uncharacterized protein n=1 Tax=Naganishia liquefaciens TaxID=104408 RepID=A0A8H3TS10_9TREE|nr:hypothetical protein NliqN6_2336 [Naganishia liquefaciens]
MFAPSAHTAFSLGDPSLIDYRKEVKQEFESHLHRQLTEEGIDPNLIQRQTSIVDDLQQSTLDIIRRKSQTGTVQAEIEPPPVTEPPSTTSRHESSGKKSVRAKSRSLTSTIYRDRPSTHWPPSRRPGHTEQRVPRNDNVVSVSTLLKTIESRKFLSAVPSGLSPNAIEAPETQSENNLSHDSIETHGKSSCLIDFPMRMETPSQTLQATLLTGRDLSDAVDGHVILRDSIGPHSTLPDFGELGSPVLGQLPGHQYPLSTAIVPEYSNEGDWGMLPVEDPHCFMSFPAGTISRNSSYMDVDPSLSAPQPVPPVVATPVPSECTASYSSQIPLQPSSPYLELEAQGILEERSTEIPDEWNLDLMADGPRPRDPSTDS